MNKRIKISSRTIFFFIILLLIVPNIVKAKTFDITDEAQRLYKKYKKNVYQIKIVSKATGKKSTLGSGFQFTKDGYIATNYHVISDAVQRPNKFYIECISFDNTVTTLKIINFDTIHDLAIVKNDVVNDSFFHINNGDIQKGTKIFSMGNPYDLGMTIVEGLYNGLMKKSLYQKILFSGSLNSGMSGGPAFNHSGDVIGVNVSTQGNQVSFLVPAKYLKNLYDKTLEEPANAPNNDWDIRVENQLIANQKNYITNLINASWDHIPVGNALVPGEISDSFKCWSDSEDDKTNLYDVSYINCFNDDDIYIDSKFNTGKISFRYKWVTSKGLNPIRFYNLYERIFSYFEPYENAMEKNVEKFSCNTDFVKIDGIDSKISLCARRYKKYPKLYDINLSVASVDKNDRGLIIILKSLGLTEDFALNFIKKFLKEITWKK